MGIEKGVEKSGYLVKDASGHLPKAEIELLFGNLGLVAGALFAAGVLILIAGLAERATARNREIGIREAAWIGAVQGLCLPFRGFSRSGATISTGLLLGVLKARVEEFSFALAVILTPAAIGREVWRLVKAHHEAGHFDVTWSLFAPSLLGMVFAFLAGLLALKWLSRWLEGGRWYLFGVYCLVAACRSVRSPLPRLLTLTPFGLGGLRQPSADVSLVHAGRDRFLAHAAIGWSKRGTLQPLDDGVEISGEVLPEIALAKHDRLDLIAPGQRPHGAAHADDRSGKAVAQADDVPADQRHQKQGGDRRRAIVEPDLAEVRVELIDWVGDASPAEDHQPHGQQAHQPVHDHPPGQDPLHLGINKPVSTRIPLLAATMNYPSFRPEPSCVAPSL